MANFKDYQSPIQLAALPLVSYGKLRYRMPVTANSEAEIQTQTFDSNPSLIATTEPIAWAMNPAKQANP